jgi:hypothetical protein
MADTPDLGSGSARSGGSSPLARTTFIGDFEENDIYHTVSAQIPEGILTPKLRFPKVIRFRRIEATIYGKTKNIRITGSFIVLGERKFPICASSAALPCS